MGLTIRPYRVQTALPSYSHLHRHRSFISPICSSFSSFEINTETIVLRRPSSAHAEQRRFLQLHRLPSRK